MEITTHKKRYKINNAGNIVDLMELILLIHLILRQITSHTAADNNGNVTGRVDVEIMVPLKYLSNFWRTLEMLLINCEFELILDWSVN